jgi:hypothetical protein
VKITVSWGISKTRSSTLNTEAANSIENLAKVCEATWHPRNNRLSSKLRSQLCMLLLHLAEPLWNYELRSTVVGVGVLIATDSQSTSLSGYRASLWDPRPDFILFFFFSVDKYLIILSMASSLTRKRVCILQWNHPLVPITILYFLIWDCVPFLSPLTTRRDYGGSILTRLHTG